MITNNDVVKAPDLVKDTWIFQGAEHNPLLAPRGVFLVQGKLIVCDTGQNRVFIWNSIPRSSHQDPDLFLGQDTVGATGRNADGKVSASTLQYPSGLWSDGERLVVADAWNHRVLIWNTFPTQNGQPADVVLGQADFQSNQPNVEGVGKPPSAQTLYWPYGVYSDGQHLFIADTGNRRVLFYEAFPEESFAAADRVIGKESFTERDYENEDPIWPYSIKLNAEGALAITDTQYYRVLLWDHWEKAFTEKASRLIGQADFSSNGQNQFGWFPEAHTLNWCYDTCFYKGGIFVADTGNSRVLWFPQVPQDSNQAATGLIGQDNFQTGSENQNTIKTTENSLYWPFHLSVEEQTLVIADTGNHRIVIVELRN